MSSTISKEDELPEILIPPKGVTVLVPNGSMREKMLMFLRARGFSPVDEECVAAFCTGDKYAEGSLGIWQKEDGADVIEVVVRDRRELPFAVEEAATNEELVVALTCNDMALNSWLCLASEGRDVGENIEDVFRMYPLPVTSGRNGGNARWAMLVPKEEKSGKKIYPDSSELTVLSELPLLALELGRSTGLDGRVGNIFEIQGSEEQRLLDANATGLDTAAICVVESGKSAEEKGLAVIELLRVRTKAILSKRLAEVYPIRANIIEKMLGLPNACPVLWPDFEKRGGLVTVVMQDEKTGQVLMVASANAAAYRETLETGVATFWSTSRNELWIKGETSGNVFRIRDVRIDCDSDALIYIVEPATTDAVACHTGELTCFYRSALAEALDSSDKEPVRTVAVSPILTQR